MHEPDSADCTSKRAASPPTAAEDVLRSVLAALHASGCPYALLQPDRPLVDMLASDVDIAFGCNPNEAMLPILHRISRSMDARLIQCLHYEIPSGYYYVIAVGTPPRFLHLDCLYDPVGINRYRLPTPFLLQSKVEGRHGARVSDARLALYFLMKRAVKGDASPDALRALRDGARENRDELLPQVRTWFGGVAVPLVERLLRCEDGDEVRSILKRLRVLAERRFRRHAPARYLLSLAWDAARKARRFLQQSGLFVVLLGPDGAGKSTVAARVMSELDRAFRRTWRFHWRPGLLPKLRRSQAPNAEPELLSPPQRAKYGRAVSLVRFAWYWLDFVAGYWLRIYPRKARTTLVIGERYFPDVLVNPARYGFALSKPLLRLAASFVPSPDLVVLLTDRPESIHARKPELSVPAVAEQLVFYRGELEHWGEAVAVETTGDAGVVASRVRDLILAASARRTSSRLPRREAPQWRAFPSAAHARLWVADNDTLANAANLHRPYSLVGRVLERALRLVPPTLLLAWPWTRPDADTAERFACFAAGIRKVLGEQVRVSFAERTGDPRRRLTAQASIGNTPIAYVKIARGQDAETLQHEANMIAWMQDRLAGTAALPAVLGIETVAQSRLLFLAAPACQTQRRPLAPDQRDVRFLSQLAQCVDENHTVEMVLQMIGSQGLLDRIVGRGDRGEAVLRGAIERVRNAFGERRVRTGPAHGDYGPWNARALADGSLLVFDWEHARMEAPLLTDLFHRVVMPARLVLRQAPRSVIERLVSLHEDPLLGPVIIRSGVQRSDIGAYVLLYLLGLAMRDEAEYGGVSDFVTQALDAAIATCDGGGGRPKVLVAAYACEPGGGSEPGVGWNVCQAISREHDAWVITRRNNRDAIEAALRRTPNPNLHFHYADLPRWARFWKRGARGIRTYYYLWQFAAALEAWRLMRRVRFDVAHHVTFVNSYVFSFLALLPLPFVWGPLGNNPLLPGALASSPRALLRDRLRYAWQRLLRAADPLFWLCVYRASVVLGINASIGRHLPFAVLARSKFAVHPAIAVEGHLTQLQTPSRREGEPVRILSMGQLIPIKGFHLALRAFAELLRTQPDATLEIVGDGPEKAALHHLADVLGIAGNVRFAGWLPREDALAHLAAADVFLFPSCEGGGMVVLEAMAHGLPTVCLDYGGPGEMITADCGIAVGVADLDTTVSALADALATLACDPSLRQKMAQGARKRVAERYSWELRHEFIRRWYEAALSQPLRQQRVGGA